jgi:hypothetical protein
MILKYFDFSTSILIVLFLILFVCAIVMFLAGRSIRKISIANLRERLACAVQYSSILTVCLLILNMFFQNTPFLGEPTDFDTPQRLIKTHYTQIENLKLAQFALYYTFIFTAVTFLNLLKIALKSQKRDPSV